MQYIDIPTEQTTAVTDFLLALLAIWAALKIQQAGGKTSPKKARIWLWVFVLLAIGALFGAIAHGFKMDEKTNSLLWQPLFLSLGLAVSMFAAGAIFDLKKGSVPKIAIPLLLAMGFGFYLVTVFVPGSFLVFILYEAIVMIFALVAYLVLALKKKLSGAWWMVGGIFVTIIAAAIQATETLHITLIWEFDYNGIFHLVQMVGIFILVNGLLINFRKTT
jgi:hypothetical protein